MTIIYRTNNGWLLMHEQKNNSFIYTDDLCTCRTFHSDRGLLDYLHKYFQFDDTVKLPKRDAKGHFLKAK